MIVNGNALHLPLADSSVQCCITSPPYFGLRDYGTDGQLGLEPTPEEYVANLVAVFREVRRVLRPDATVFLNLGDSYSSKQLTGIPWRVAFALQADGWWLRSDIIWAKPNPMPESVKDRPTRSHEYLFLLTKSARYYYDSEAIKEPAQPFHVCGPNSRANADRTVEHGTRKQDAIAKGTYVGFNERYRESPVATRNKRDVWTIATRPYSGAHFATMPPDLVEPCVRAGSKPGDVVLDPFAGAGTVPMVAERHGRTGIGVELSMEYCRMAERRIYDDAPLLAGLLP